MNDNALDSYLVKLGFDFNISNLSKFLNLFSNAKKQIASSMPTFKGDLASATVSMVSFVAKAAVAIGELVDAVADSDKKLSLSAKQKWMNKDAYEAMTNAVDQLGYSLEEIAIDPELTRQFSELYSFTQGLQVDESLKQNLELVRSIGLEFKKFGTVGKFLFKNLGIQLSNYLGEDLKKLKADLSDLNEKLAKNLPKIVDRITDLIGPIFRAGVQIIDKIISKSDTIGKMLDRWVTHIQKVWNALSFIVDLVMLFIDLLEPLSQLLMPIVDMIDYMLDGLSIFTDALAPTLALLADPFGEYTTSNYNNVSNYDNSYAYNGKNTYNFYGMTQEQAGEFALRNEALSLGYGE